ncbi:MAG: metallophosphoesterase [Rikenellaceae bacterium]|nr:metallophosphoesterase [Rikenellaceae bacterium]
MAIFFLILVSSIVALWVDRYIYRRLIVSRGVGRRWKAVYIIYAVLVDTMVVAALVAYNTVLDWESTAAMRTILWIIGIFFLNAVPKFIYTVVSLPDKLRTGKSGRPSHIFGRIGAVLAVGCFLWIGYGLTFGRSEIRVERLELTFDNLPPSFDGTRVAVFADIHLGNVVNHDRFLGRLCDTINNLRPDIIVNGGDIVNVNQWELDETALDILGGLKARYGIFAVLGNHDLGIYIKDTVKTSPRHTIEQVTAKQERLGWHVLRDASVPVVSGKDTIYITGLDYPDELIFHSHSPLAGGRDLSHVSREIPTDAFDLAITHAPQLWDEMLKAGIGDLTLAGHVHSMQIKFRMGKLRWSPARLFYRRWSGLYEEDGKYLYINDGTGYVMFPMRIGTRPEVTLITLRCGVKTDIR